MDTGCGKLVGSPGSLASENVFLPFIILFCRVCTVRVAESCWSVTFPFFFAS